MERGGICLHERIRAWSGVYVPWRTWCPPPPSPSASASEGRPWVAVDSRLAAADGLRRPRAAVGDRGQPRTAVDSCGQPRTAVDSCGRPPSPPPTPRPPSLLCSVAGLFHISSKPRYFWLAHAPTNWGSAENLETVRLIWYPQVPYKPLKTMVF